MTALKSQRISLSAEIERWPLTEPFRISGFTWEALEVLTVTVECEGCVGRGEGAGVYYRGDVPAEMLRQIESARTTIEAGVSRESIQPLLPAGGARNALDCALWDLEAKLRRKPAWEIAGMAAPRGLLTTFACGADLPQRMAATARGYSSARAIKIKLTGDPLDGDRIRAVRGASPHVWLAVDANQGFSRAHFEKLLPVLVEERVALIEQPFPVGQEMWLDSIQSPIPVAADESLQGVGDLEALVGRFQVVNVKLDKSGGLTAALALAKQARALGFQTMIGNMIGTSLAMTPAILVGQLCQVVDLDGPVFLQIDRQNPVSYIDGCIEWPRGNSWGSPN